MQRYYNALGCMDKRDDGDYVLHSEAKAEVARLTAEVERLKLAKLYDEKAKDRALLLEKHSISDTAWNDAIEAAAKMSDPHSDRTAEKIRLLNRT